MSKDNRYRERRREHEAGKFADHVGGERGPRSAAPPVRRSFRDTPVEEPTADRKVGVVTRIVDPRVKGFGFVKGDDGQEYFIHRSSCQVPWDGNGRIEQGDRVAFTGTLNAKGFRALNVARAEEEIGHGQERHSGQPRA